MKLDVACPHRNRTFILQQDIIRARVAKVTIDPVLTDPARPIKVGDMKQDRKIQVTAKS